MTSTLPPAAFLPLTDSGQTGTRQTINRHEQGVPQEGVPLSQGETVRGAIIVPDLEHPQPVVTFTTSRHTDVTITLDELDALRRMAYETTSTAGELVNRARLSWSHPLETSLGQELLKEAKNGLYSQDYPIFLVLKDDDEKREGTPILRWTRKYFISNPGRRDEQDGWTLGFVEGDNLGVFTTTVGFARWDRPDAVANLIQQMGDRETLMIISAMTNADATSALSAKETARTILADRGRAKVETKPVKLFLQRNNLVTSENEPQYQRGRLRVLAIKLNGAKKLPVAIAILTPQAPGTPEEKQALKDRYPSWTRDTDAEEARAAQQAIWRAAWETRFHATLSDLPGWRLVDLPQPQLKKTYSVGQTPWEHVNWVTPFDEDTWSSFAAAATREAKMIQMTENSVF